MNGDDIVRIIRTKFTSLTTQEETFGVRICDKNGRDYADNWEFAEILKDDLALLQLIVDRDIGEYAGGGDGILDWLKMFQADIEIDGIRYSWKEIESVIDKGV